MKERGGLKVDRLIKLMIQIQSYRLEGEEVRVKKTRANMEVNLGQILKSNMAGRVAHGFNLNKNIVLIQEG